MFSFVAFFAVAPLAWTTWRGALTHKMLLAHSACITISALALLAWMHIPADLDGATNATSIDRIYVTNSAFGILIFACASALLGLLGLMAHGYARAVAPNLQRIAVWAFVLGGLMPQLLIYAHLQPSQLSADFQTGLLSIIYAKRYGTPIALIAAFCLITLPLWALTFRRLGETNQTDS